MERKRNMVLAEVEYVTTSYRRAVEQSGAPAGILNEYEEEPYDFENLDDEVVESDSNTTVNVVCPVDETDEPVVSPPERRPVLLPSTCLSKDHPLSITELQLRKDQANRYIMALREVIAEKSFQYTHVIRVAPRKAIVTRARNVILKLNQKISFYSRMYGRCRAALLRLVNDIDSIRIFKVLTRQDVKASSAVVNPNTPGSTTLSLSWIWQLTAAGEESPASLRECVYYCFLIINR